MSWSAWLILVGFPAVFLALVTWALCRAAANGRRRPRGRSSRTPRDHRRRPPRDGGTHGAARHVKADGRVVHSHLQRQSPRPLASAGGVT